MYRAFPIIRTKLSFDWVGPLSQTRDAMQCQIQMLYDELRVLRWKSRSLKSETAS